MGKSVYSVCKRITSVSFFVNKRTNEKLLFAWRANVSRLRKSHGLPFSIFCSKWQHIYRYIYIYVYRYRYVDIYRYIHLYIYICAADLIYIWKTKNGSFFSLVSKRYQTGQYDDFTSLLSCRLGQFTERTSRVYVTCVLYIKNFPWQTFKQNASLLFCPNGPYLLAQRKLK
jgi:hypothetical protein